MSPRRGRASLLWFATTERPRKPATHGKRCQCARCWPASVSVRAPDAQLALPVLAAKVAARLGAPPPDLPAPPPPPPPKETKEQKEAKRRALDAAHEKATAARIAQLVKPPERPATPEELAALKKEYGFGPRGKDGRR